MATNKNIARFDIDYRQSSVSNFRFTTTTLDSVVVENCDWQDVTFTGCNLQHVVFRNITLRNAHFADVDLRNVTMRATDLRDVAWSRHHLANAVLSADSFKTTPSREIVEVLILDARRRSRTRGGQIGGNSTVAAQGGHLHGRPGLRTMRLATAPRKGLMGLPDSLLLKIAGYLLRPDSPINIIDCPPLMGPRLSKTKGSQTHYSLPDRPSPVTYITDVARLGLSPSFLRVNRRLYMVGTPVLYGRRFRFRKSLQSCLAFLHDHRKWQHAIKRLTLVHPGIEEENGRVFKELVDVLLYTQPELRDVTVPGDYPVLPQDLARLPLKHGGHDLSVIFYINGFEANIGRTFFQRAVRSEFLALRQLQPPSHPSTRYPRCQQSRLEKCQCKRAGETQTLREIPNLLDLPEKALKRIVHFLFPVDQLRIMEKPGYVSLSPDSNQTTYYRKRVHCQTTYIAWDRKLEEKEFLVQRVPLPKPGVYVSFLRVSRSCYKLGIPYLYSRGLQFDSNPATCLSFLHDHQKREHSIKHITVLLDRGSSCQSWRRLFNAFVHRRSDLRSLTVKPGDEFWDTSPWQWQAPDARRKDTDAGVKMSWSGKAGVRAVASRTAVASGISWVILLVCR
ncbi:hypothetical protein M409DRAFT_28455 [Zasmidium cellare ATCC 36951]|uniref:Uncharacterized protein n=1 Tax=Zasmidium cellare ATCC 36951 TaxID=1080233 RepID=A0A6A6C2B3_ZASCE|nr:uncharacterized protein M409DRAFT_28455 [Zasmidium cellare ATCC 36951]KAF2161125.1 hypothetical protein M409DRAFT_28455 [Zasmidium cellare ATCC 36951]